MGVNLLNGAVAGKGVDPGTPTEPTGASGQSVSYNFTKILTLEDLYSSVGVSAKASGHYNLFSASGKFKFLNETKFTSQSIFLLARCIVENSFQQCEQAVLTLNAAELIKAGKADQFQERYGDGFIRGMQMGGEYFAIISISSSSQEIQQSTAASLQAQYGGVVGSAGIDVKLQERTKELITQCQINITTYQRAGAGEEQAFTDDIEEVLKRMYEFPSIVLGKPVPYEVQVASYRTIDLPDSPNIIDIENQKSSLADYARLHMKLITLRNDVEFIQTHPRYFTNPPSIVVLNAWQSHIAEQITSLIKQASLCCNSPAACPLLPLLLPSGFYVPERANNVFVADDPMLNLLLTELNDAIVARDWNMFISLYDPSNLEDAKRFLRATGVTEGDLDIALVYKALEPSVSHSMPPRLSRDDIPMINRLTVLGIRPEAPRGATLITLSAEVDPGLLKHCEIYARQLTTGRYVLSPPSG